MKTEFANQKVLLIFVQANSKLQCECGPKPEPPKEKTCEQL